MIRGGVSVEDVRESPEIWVFMTLVIGFAVSFPVAVVPHFNGAFRLVPLVLAAWMVPYLILSVIVYFMRGPLRLRLVLAVVGAQLVTAWIQRGLLGGSDSGLLYAVALLTAVLLVLLVPQLQGRVEEGPLGPIFKRFANRS
jgi:hypothetical protein